MWITQGRRARKGMNENKCAQTSQRGRVLYNDPYVTRKTVDIDQIYSAGSPIYIGLFCHKLTHI